MSALPEAQLDDLVAHSVWVRELARSLVSDPQVAEDVSQEALLSALKQPPGAIRSMRGWLAGAVRNLTTDRIRRESRRRRRESVAAAQCDEPAPSTAELYERMSAHREVVGAVLGLPEHYRVVLVRRYYEGETPTRIAEQLDVPVGTVKTRLQRALKLLREQLDERGGGTGKAWIAVLAPILRAPSPKPGLPQAGAGSSVAGLAAAVLVAALSLGLTGWWLWPGSGPRAAEQRAATAPGLRSGTASVEPLADAVAGAGAGRRTVPESWREELLDNDLNAGATPLRGTAYWSDGSAAVGVVLRFEAARDAGLAGEPVAVTGAGGDFEFAAASGGTGLVVALPGTGRTTVWAGRASGETRDGLGVVLADTTSLRGVVRDQRGDPVPAARIRIEPPADFVTRFVGGLGAAVPLRHAVVAGMDGSFEIADLPRLEGGRILVEADGYLPGPRVLLAGLGPVWEPRMERLGAEAAIVGRVVDGAGRPIAGARVGTGRATAWSDQDGRFRVAPDPERYPETVTACATGRAPVSVVVGAQPVEIVLDAAPARIAGRVVDAAGRPVRGISVYVADGTVLWAGEADQDAAGARVAREFTVWNDPRIDRPRSAELAEAWLLGHPDAPWQSVSTDTNGRFTLEGLGRGRDYEVVALDPGSLAETRRVVDSGQDGVVLTLPSPTTWRTVRGSLRDLAGQPVVGARIGLSREVFRVVDRGRELLRHRRTCQVVLSSATGSFVLHDVPPGDYLARISGAGVFTETVSLADLDALRLRPRARLRVAAAAPRWRFVQTLEASGEVLPLEWRDGQSRSRAERAPLRGGASRLLDVDARAAYILLFDAEAGDGRRVPIALSAGRTVVVRP